MDMHKIGQIGEVKWKKLFLQISNKIKNWKVVCIHPFAMKPLNKIWCNQLPSEVT